MNYLQKKKLAFMSIVNQIKGFIMTISGAFPLTLTDCVDNKSITNYSIHGNSMQDGVPTPDAPIEVESVGEYDESIGKYKIPITVSGKNLFNENDYFASELINLGGGYVGYEIQLKANTTYAVSVTSNNQTLYAHIRIGTTTNADTACWLSHVTNNYLTLKPNATRNFTTTDNGLVYLCNSGGAAVRIDDCISGLQIKEGKTATEYEPYHEPITTNIYLDEPLRKVGDYADYIDFENGKVVRNIGKYTFTGDEKDHGGAVGYTGSFGYTANISDLSLTAHKVGLCNYLTQSGLNGSVNRFAFHETINHPFCYIFFLEKDFPDLGTYSPETAKQIVKQMYDGGEPLILYYNTNTPTKETVALPIIPTFKGTSIISVDTTIQPSNAEIEYYSNAKER